jgi:hypothetical protein
MRKDGKDWRQAWEFLFQLRFNERQRSQGFKVAHPLNERLGLHSDREREDTFIRAS